MHVTVPPREQQCSGSNAAGGPRDLEWRQRHYLRREVEEGARSAAVDQGWLPPERQAEPQSDDSAPGYHGFLGLGPWRSWERV